MKTSGIYQIQSIFHPDRLYIGSAANIMQRWNIHLKTLRSQKHRNCRLQAHFNKYGESDLQFSILEYCDKSVLLNREQYYLDSLNPSFNICRRAGSPRGIKWPEESRLKFSQRQTGRKLSEEHKKKIGESGKGRIGYWKGKKLSEETKLKMKGRNMGNKYRLGTHHSEETKQKLRESSIRNGNKPPIRTKKIKHENAGM